MSTAASTPSEHRSLDHEFRAVLRKSPKQGGWTYIVMPGSAEFFGTRGLGEGSRDRRRPPVSELAVSGLPASAMATPTT